MTDQKIGYRKPPTDTQFRKGQSGNPKGRPKKQPSPALTLKDKPLQQQFEEEAYRLLRLQENGKSIELSATQALVRSIFMSALKGNRINQKYLLELLRSEEEKAATRHNDHYAHYRKLQKQGYAAIKQAKDNNQPVPKIYPHPDDILLDPKTREVRVVGPLTEDDLPAYRRHILLRDNNIATYIKSKGRNTLHKPDNMIQGVHLLMVTLSNDILPPSLRQDQTTQANALIEWSSLGKRQFERKLAAITRELETLPDDSLSPIERYDQQRQQTQTAINNLANIFKAVEEGIGQKLKEKKSYEHYQ